MPYLPDYRSIGSRYMMWKWLLACSSSFPSLLAVIYIYIYSRACPPYYPVLTRARNFINRVSHVCCLLFAFAHNVVFKLSTLDGRLNSVTNEKRTQRDAREYICIYMRRVERLVDFSIIFSLVDYVSTRKFSSEERLSSFEKTKQIDFARENTIFNSKKKFIIIIVSIRLNIFLLFVAISEYFACRFVLTCCQYVNRGICRVRNINEMIRSNYLINIYISKHVAQSQHVSRSFELLFV